MIRFNPGCSQRAAPASAATNRRMPRRVFVAHLFHFEQKHFAFSDFPHAHFAIRAQPKFFLDDHPRCSINSRKLPRQTCTCRHACGRNQRFLRTELLDRRKHLNLGSSGLHFLRLPLTFDCQSTSCSSCTNQPKAQPHSRPATFLQRWAAHSTRCMPIY